MLWRCGLPEDLSALGDAAAPVAFPPPFDAAFVDSFKVGGTEASPSVINGPGPAATESPFTVAMAFILSLGRVLVEPME